MEEGGGRKRKREEEEGRGKKVRYETPLRVDNPPVEIQHILATEDQRSQTQCDIWQLLRRESLCRLSNSPFVAGTQPFTAEARESQPRPS